jgi:hypothetical protein
MTPQTDIRRLLIVSPGFAPANAPDSHRARLSLPHWKACGWKVEVLAVKGEDVEAPQEPELLDSIPGDVPVHRVSAWPRRLMRCLGVGSLSWRASGALRRAGVRILTGQQFDLVLFSTSQFGVLPLGPWWLQRTGVPYVLDFQDPWVTDYYEKPGAPRPPGGWKYRLARQRALHDEPHTLRQAAGIVSVSSRYLDDFGARYPWFDRRRSVVLPFPAADTDLARLAVAGPSRLPSLQPGFKHVVAIGAVGPYMRRSVTGLCAALARLRSEHATVASKLRFHFIGTSYAVGALPSVLPLALTAGVADLVEEQTARVGYYEALRWMLAGDALLAVGSDDPGYVPSRLANLVWLGKPLLTIASSETTLADRLVEWGITPVHSPEASEAIGAWLRALAEETIPPATPVPASWREEHGSEGMTRRLADFLRQCCAESPRGNRNSRTPSADRDPAIP